MKVCSVCMRCYEDAADMCIVENHNALNDGRPGNCEIIPGIKLTSLLEIDRLREVYSAVNTEDNKDYIVSIINRSSFGDDENLRQFLHEAKLLSEYEHGNLVRIYDAGILEKGDVYLVSDSVKGQTLKQSLASVGVPAEVSSVIIARQTLEGLEALHSLGLIHRNINPDNILLTTDEQNRLLVKIQNVDFGALNQIKTAFSSSNSDKRINNLKYFSPEQCTVGENTDYASDIYSLGAVLYELLSGKPPFNGEDALEIVEQQIKNPAPSVKIANFDIQALLSHSLSTSLQKQPNLRHKSAASFARQLRHIEQLVTHSSAPAAPVLTKVSTDIPTVQIVTTQQLNNFFASSFPEFLDNKEGILSEADVDEVVDSIKPVEEFAQSEVSVKGKSKIVKPVLIEWEQPEDIPSEDEVRQIRLNQDGENDLYDEEEFITNSPNREFVEDEDDVPAAAVAYLNGVPNFLNSNYAKLAGGVLALLALFIFTGFILSRFSGAEDDGETSLIVQEQKTEPETGSKKVESSETSAAPEDSKRLVDESDLTAKQKRLKSRRQILKKLPKE